jgi:hypothetical protein
MIVLDERLHRRAKAFAARQGLSLSALVAEALQLRLNQSRSGARAPVSLPTFRGDGLQPGVDLDDLSTVYDRMDGLR